VGWFAVLASGLALAPLALPDAGDAERPARPSLRELTQVLLPVAGDPGIAPLPAVLGATVPRPAARRTAPGERAARRDDGPAGPARARQPVEDPSGHALDAFYSALEATRGGGTRALVRVLHYGDSMLTGDGISQAARTALQARFGDGGHGFVLAGRPWRWYHHHGWRGSASDGVRVNRVTANPVPDGRMGLGGVAFRTFQGGSRFVFEPEEGGRGQRFTLFYEAAPRGGALSLRVRGEPAVRVDTAADAPASRAATVEARSPGRHVVEATYEGGGEVRVFGLAAELPGPGLVWDSLGVNGLHAANFRRFDAGHLADQIRLRAPSLLVVMLGTNESQNPSLDMEAHGRDYLDLLALLRRGAPDASCLVVSPPDRAQGHRTGGRSVVGRIVARQRALASEAGCGFWSTFDAMGGEGSAAAWRRIQPPLMGGDLTHPTPAGAEVVGRDLAAALLAGFEAWAARRGPRPRSAADPRGGAPCADDASDAAARDGADQTPVAPHGGV
jgi:lysophospholipase L1-like esterase